MPVPKAAVDEDDLTFFYKNDIRFSRQALSVQSVPIAQGEQCSTYDHLRPGMNRSNGLHDFAALLYRAEVYHESSRYPAYA
jgi:hypothetical protein